MIVKPCQSCIDRQKMIRTAYQATGLKGVVKVMPAVIKHSIARETRNGRR